MGKFVLTIAGLAVVISALVTVAIERHWTKEENTLAEAMQEQATQLAQASAENARLSNLVAQTTAPRSLAPEEFRELIRLRNEVGQLHKLSEEKSALEATNARMRDMATKSEQTLASAKTLPNYWPKEQLAFAGFADPESAVKSMLAAMRDGDLRALMNCFDPADVPNFDAQMKSAVDVAAKEAEIKTAMRDFLAPSDGFHVIDDRMTGPGEATINLSMDGEGRVQKFVLKKFNDGWKLASGL